MKIVRALAHILSFLNVLLALSFFPLVPLLGWLNYGHASWAAAWMPEPIILVILPAVYYVYWHGWFILAAPAIGCSFYLWQREKSPAAKMWVWVNGATIVMYVAVRVTLAVLGIWPDSV